MKFLTITRITHKYKSNFVNRNYPNNKVSVNICPKTSHLRDTEYSSCQKKNYFFLYISSANGDI